MEGMYIENARLESFGASSARLLRPTGLSDGRAAVKELRQSLRRIESTYAAVNRRYSGENAVPSACEWLLDNRYLARREALGALDAFRAARRLRRCGEDCMLLALCRTLVEASGGAITEERCRLFLRGFQSVTVLSRAELALFPQALRAALLSAIAGVCAELRFAADTAPMTAAFEALFGSLRLFSSLDPDALLQEADRVQEILNQDPSGDFARMDRETREDYLRRVERLARRAGEEEPVCARRLVARARAEGKHIGVYLYAEPKSVRARLYIGANLVLTLLLSLLPAFALGQGAAAPLLLLPASELVKSLLDFILLRLVRPTRLPRMDMSGGVPAEGKTLCVVSALLSDAEGARALARRLEELRLASRQEGRNLLFGLLADLPAADTETTAEDEALLRAAGDAVEALNRQYGGGFYLFTRARRFDGTRWTGWERKRGALLELARLLCGLESALRVVGAREALTGARFILTLDSDTRLYPGAAGELIGALLHPLNRPHLDAHRRVVDRGHAVLHPRIDAGLESACATDFALVFAGSRGSDPYGGLCGELYMDAFGNGGFAGKGILDARCLLACTEHALPEGRVLSHDALEGAYLRGGFCGDVALSDSFPARPLAWYRRLHRWIRGDWQNARWIFSRRLGALDRWRLFDSLRRSLLAPLTLLALLLGLLLPERASLAAGAALLALAGQLFLSLAGESLRQRDTAPARRFTRLLSGVGGALVQCYLRLWLLPCEAAVSVSAIALSLWRMLVSHRNLLQWQTAAQSERGAAGLGAHLASLWPSSLLGLALLAFSPSVPGKAAGLSWFFAPLAAFALSLPAYAEPALHERERNYLRTAAAEALGYYLDTMDAENHFLPPDNFQEQPPVGIAHRTSPTNIGLALLSLAAGAKLGLIGCEAALGRIEAALTTLEKLPRHRGHFYNWYDTQSLAPLSPPYLSTVDSGNLAASLLALSALLSALGAPAPARRARSLYEAMDFGFLFDPGRGLFYISYDPAAERGRGGWYDLMASEAMLTSYLALARGQIPRKHWARLGRGQLQKDGYRGLASWTGTMFEYRMPALFLPYLRGSLLYESSRFCLWAQKRRVAPSQPWGVSESAFYSLDPTLSYRYKPSGVAALALKREQDRDLVVSPYSSFLVLALDPHGALRNLRRLEGFGARGRYGFMEAVDFTPVRCRGRAGEPVRCYMAHHIGMSVLAAANLLGEGLVEQSFMADAAMAAHRLLLEERPGDGRVLRRDRSEGGERGETRGDERWCLRGSGQGEARCLLSNGVYHLLLDQNGRSRALCRESLLYGEDTLRESAGLLLELTIDDRRVSLSPAEPESAWEFSEEQARWQGETEALRWEYSLAAAAGELGERRCVTLRASRDCAVALRLCFSPRLARTEDWHAHPAFWRLGLESRLTPDGLLLHRLRRGAQPALWLCLKGGEGTVCEADLRLPLAAAACPLSLKAGESRTLCFALCLGANAEEAEAGAARILDSRERGSMVSAAAARLGLSAAELGGAMALLPALAQPLAEAAPRRELWPYGVSGDYPILAADARAVEAPALLSQWLLLKSCGAESELVFLSEEQGEYRRPTVRRAAEALGRLQLEALIGSRGGVHFAPAAASKTVLSRAACAVGYAPLPGLPLRLPRLSRARVPGCVPEHAWDETGFTFTVLDELPGRAWQLPLSNGRFGAILADIGPCALWQENAREQRLCEPTTDIRSVRPPLSLWVERGAARRSLFAANDGARCRVRFEPGLAVWEKELDERTVRTTAFIPPDSDALLLLIEGAAGLSLQLAMQPTLGPDASALRLAEEGELLVFDNPESYSDGLRLLVGASLPVQHEVGCRPSALSLRFRGTETALLALGCCPERALRDLLRPETARAALERCRRFWRAKVEAAPLRCDNAALSRYLNGWAVYQTLCCRLWARASLYQSGGAFGFRDQLQDAVNLLPLQSALARERIEDACRHQYEEGDVMHWWHPHPAGDRGVRTRCSDDLLWLVWALCEYVDACGVTDFCLQALPWRHSSPLRADERDRYETPALTENRASVLDHARAALDCCLRRGVGAHGLPFFGSGDWNDGLDAVDGESVWLGWFLSHCCERFAALLERLRLPDGARYREAARRFGEAANAAWGGRWYFRGYTADGQPLGGAARLDALPQAWAALSPYADPERVQTALAACLARLVDEKHRLVKLFDPPYTEAEPSPGYLTSYGAGFRENGGQYTHAAIWLARAFAFRGERETALRLLGLLLPEGRELRRYEAEPFVLAADITAAPGREGEAGWTWYTGSAGWFWRTAREILGE